MADFHDFCEVIFWNFVRKNNVVYNFEIINALINDASEKNIVHYCKPIIILMMAVIECTLYDFLLRIQQERHEGINLSKKEKSIIRQKNISDKLQHYIDICKRHALLGSGTPNIYDELLRYSKIRNRVHIQNLRHFNPVDEWELWDKKKVQSCGRLLHDIFVYLCANYPRPKDRHNSPNLNDLPTPWEKL